MNTQHTPGPWRIDFEKHYCGVNDPNKKTQAFAIMAGRKVVAAVLTAWRKPDPQANADARLIAAAPELLEACLAVYNDPYTNCACADKVRAAIAKATSNQ